MKKINVMFADLLDHFDSRKIAKFIFYLVILIFLLIFVTAFNSALVAILLFVLACISTVYKLYLKIPIGFELISLMVIIFSYKYSIIFTIMMMIMAVVIARVISAGIHPTMITQILNYTFIIMISPLFSGLDIFTAGMILIVIFNIVRIFLYIFIYGFNPLSAITSCVGSVIIYYVLLSSFAAQLLAALG